MKTKWHFLVLEQWNIYINSSHMKIQSYAEMPSWYLVSWLLIVRVSIFSYFSMWMCVVIKAVGVPWEKNPILTAQNKSTNSATVNSTDFEKKITRQLYFPPTLIFISMGLNWNSSLLELCLSGKAWLCKMATSVDMTHSSLLQKLQEKDTVVLIIYRKCYGCYLRH